MTYRITFIVFLLLSPYSQAEDFPIGVMTCLSGSCAEWGAEALNGARMAVEEANAQGGILNRKISLVVEDTNEDQASTPISAFRRLLAKGNIHYFIGPSWTPAGLAIGPIAKKLPVIVTSPSLGVREFNETADNLFNVWPHDEVTSRALGKYAAEKGWKRAVIFSCEQRWTIDQSDAFSEALKAAGGTVVERVQPLPTEMKVETDIVKLVRTKPDVVLISAFSAQSGAAAKELRRMNYKGPIMSVLMDETTRTAAGGDHEGTIYGGYGDSDPEFLKKYVDLYGHKPGRSADTAYDVIGLYKKVIDEAKSDDVTIIKKNLVKVAGYRGASGVITFDEKGGIIREPRLFKVHGPESVEIPKN